MFVEASTDGNRERGLELGLLLILYSFVRQNKATYFDGKCDSSCML
jgi:hypothetical protein